MIDVGKYFPDILTELPDKEYRETLYNSTTGKNIPGNILELQVKDVAVISKQDITGNSFDLSFNHYVGINSIGVEVELNLYVAIVTEEVSDELFCVKKEDESIDIFKYKYTKCGNWSKRNPVSEAVFVKNSKNFTVGNSTVEDVYYITDDLYYDVYYNIYTVDGSDIPCINGYTIIETDRQTSEVRLKQNGQFFDVYTVDIVTTGNTTFNDNIRYIARNIPYQLHGEITKQTVDGVVYDKQYYYICYQNENGETVWVNTNVYRLYKDGREYGDINEPEEIPSEYDRYLIEKMTKYYAFLYKSTDFATEDAARRYIKNGVTADLSKFVMIELTPKLSDEVEELPNGQKVKFYYVYYRDKSMRCDEYEIYTDTGGGEPEQPEIPDNPDPNPDDPNLPDKPSDPNPYYELKPLGEYILWQEYPEWYVIKWIYKVYYNGAVERTDEYRVFAGPLEKVLNPDSREDLDWLRPRRYRIYYYVYWDDEATNTHFAQNTGLYEEYEYADDLEKDPAKANCVNFEMTGWEGTISFNNVDNPNIEYAIGEGEWQTWDYSPIYMVTNQTVYFRGHNTRLGSSDTQTMSSHFIVDGQVKLAGNASSLLNGTGEDMTTDEKYVLRQIFTGCGGITDITGFKLNVVGYGAYADAFSSCVSIKTTCDWPETIYPYEFVNTYYGCIGLTTVKPITYTSIPEYAFRSCFGRCSALVEMPELPASTLAPHCYAEMFMNSGVKRAKGLPATEIPESAYSLMFAYSSIESCADIDVVNASRMAFSGMYRDTKIKTAPSFTITGTMGDNCFNQTFRNCVELTSSALITVDALSEYCFMYMYRGCKKLDYARSLPWSLVKGCYDGMFQECTSLTESPRLAETTYAVDAYRQMFYGCTSLSTIDCNLLFDGEVIARLWVRNVSPTGTFYKNRNQENVYYSDDCVPVGWTVVDNNYTVKTEIRVELYGDYELVKNEDNTYNLVQYYYNCRYVNDVLDHRVKTDRYEVIAENLERKLYNTLEQITIDGRTYGVYYYYVEYEGVKYKTTEYQRYHPEVREYYNLRTEGEFPDFRFFYEKHKETKYYELVYGVKEYVDDMKTDEVVESTDVTDSNNWVQTNDVVWNGDNLYRKYYSLYDVNVYKYVNIPYFTEQKTERFVTQEGEFPDYVYKYHTKDITKYYWLNGGFKHYLDDKEEATDNYIDITNESSYWTYWKTEEVDGELYEIYLCTVDRTKEWKKYNKVVWISETTVTKAVSQPMTDIDNEQFIITTTTTTRYHYINYKGQTIYDDSKTETSSVELDITDLEEYWNRTGYVLRWNGSKDDYYFEYTCTEDSNFKMHYKAIWNWSSEPTYEVIRTNVPDGNGYKHHYDLKTTTTNRYTATDKFGYTVGDSENYPDEVEITTTDISDYDNETYWTKTINGSYKTYTCNYDTRYTETFKIINVNFYGFNNVLLKSYEDIEMGTHVKVPEVTVPEHYTFTGWDPPIVVDAEGYTGGITKSIDFYAEFEAKTYTINYCIYDEETSLLTIVKSYTLHYGDAVPEYSLEYSSEYGKFLGWTPEVNPICTGNAQYIAKFAGISWYTLTFMDWWGNVVDTKTVKEYTNVYSFATHSDRVYDDFSENIKFLGYYYLDGENKVFVDESTVMTSDLVLYPDFSNPICVINFYGFNNQIISSIEIKVGYEFTIPDFPEIQCYEATHWDKEVVNPPIESADYYAQYERIGYLITFLGYNNYVIDTQVVRIGENPIIPDIPKVDGMTATGNWIPEIERPATKDMTYTAEYILGTKVDYVTILQNENNIGFSTGLPWHNHKVVYVEIAGSNFYTEYSGSEPERYACLISTVDNPNEVWDYDNEIANDYSFGCSGYDEFVVAGGSSKRLTDHTVSEDNYSDSKTYIKMRTDGIYIMKGTLKSDGTIEYSNVMFGQPTDTGHSATNLYTPIWIAPKTSVKQCVTYYDIKMYTWAGGTNPKILVKHYIPWKDFDGVYCLREELTNTLHYPQIGSWSGTVRVHMVRFFGFDKVLLSKQYINTGDTLSIPNIPNVDGYKPNGWDKEIVETVTESVDYYALYQKSNNNSYIRTAGAGGVNTEVYPTRDTWMEFQVSNLSSSSGDVNIGISVDAEKGTWINPNDNSDWRFFISPGSTPILYWDRGRARSNESYSNISNRLRITCKWNEFSIYDVTNSKSIYTDTALGKGGIETGYPIWIEPMTDPSYSGDYYYIKIYEGNELIRHYIPHIDENGVYCFLEVISNKLCYPISGSYTGSVTSN